MPELKCTVQTCTHNKKFLCDLEKIQVGGDSAKSARETCCDSFQERSGGATNSASMDSMNSYANSTSDVTGNASDLSVVDCKATECMYNDNCQCHAGKISVEGSNANQAESTECATFKCQG